jgi:hypothetical protein
MIATVPLLPLFAVCAGNSFDAPAVPVTTTAVNGVSLPPGVPGTTGVTGHVSVAPTGRLAAVPLLATHAPVVTPVPLARHVASVATPGPLLVQVIVPVTVLPGAATAGRPVIAETMSALPLTTTTVAVAVSHAAGVAVAQIWYGTV